MTGPSSFEPGGRADADSNRDAPTRPPEASTSPPWRVLRRKLMRRYRFQFRVWDLLWLLTACSALFAALRTVGSLVTAIPLGLALVVVTISGLRCTNILAGQVIGAAVAAMFLLLATAASNSLSADGVGVAFIFYAPLGAWVGGVWAAVKETEID